MKNSERRKIVFRKVQYIHFIGIGGSGMNGIAEVLLNLGYRVSGSDIQETEVIRRLRKMGGQITIGHSPSNIKNAQVVVVSSAISPDNEEVLAAKKASIPVIKRAEMLAELMRLKYGIAIAGAHGKTTTTSIIASIMATAGLDPTVVIGGRLNSLGSNAKLGQGEFLVAEADESDGSFLKLSPTIGVVTNIDAEHLDYYKNLELVEKTFLDFINKVPFYGIAILCADDERIRRLLPFVEKRYLTYGVYEKADIYAFSISTQEGKSVFRVTYKGIDMGEFFLPLPGVHNVSNALASIGVAIELEISIEDVKKALQEFSGVERRFQIIGKIEKEGKDILIVDDYGHHPSEIKATLSAAKDGWGRRTVVIFQPHRYTRLYYLMQEFATAFDKADELIITDIYSAGEKPINNITGEKLCSVIKQQGHRSVSYMPDKKSIVKHLKETMQPGDMIITLGAGDIWKAGREIAELS